MKMDLGTNYTVAQGLPPVSVGTGTDAGASQDHAAGHSGAFLVELGDDATDGYLVAKVQYSDDNSAWTDDDGTTGNDYTATITGPNAVETLNVPNPMGRYTRAYVTVTSDTCLFGVTNVLGPLRHV